jgi:hypothetical protein
VAVLTSSNDDPRYADQDLREGLIPNFEETGLGMQTENLFEELDCEILDT